MPASRLDAAEAYLAAWAEARATGRAAPVRPEGLGAPPALLDGLSGQALRFARGFACEAIDTRRDLLAAARALRRCPPAVRSAVSELPAHIQRRVAEVNRDLQRTDHVVAVGPDGMWIGR